MSARSSPAAAPRAARRSDASDDDDGEDLVAGGRGIVAGSVSGSADSSEEEEDDPEEAARVAAGFIVDDEDDEEQSGDSDAEKKRKRRRRKQKRRRQMAEDEELDEDDLDLLAENTGQRRRRDERKLKRFRRGSATPEPAAPAAQDLSRMFDDDDDDMPAPSRRRGADDDDEDDDEELPSAADALRHAADARARRELAAPAPGGYEDEMEDFIDDDDDSDMSGSEVSDSEREARRAAKRAARKAERAARRAEKGSGGLDPARAGIDQEAWEELADIFGDGEDFAWAFKKGDREGVPGAEDDMDDAEDVQEESKKKVEFKDIFEPAAIKERMLTEEDDRIKRADIPERFQLALPGEEGLQLLERTLTELELDEAAKWVAPRISLRCQRLFLAPDGEFTQMLSVWQMCVRRVVQLVINEHRDAMYLFVHHPDEIEMRGEDATGQRAVYQLLNRRDLQGLVTACLRFKTLLARKESLRSTFERINEDDVELQKIRSDFDRMLDAAESTEEVGEVSDWLAMVAGQRMRDIQALDAGPSALGFKRPTLVSRYERVKKTIAVQFARRAAMPSTHLAKNYQSSTAARPHTWQDPQEEPDALAPEYLREEDGLTTTERLLDDAKLLLSHELGRDPTLRHETRTLFRYFGVIDVTPTERGEAKIDEEHPYYNFKYLGSKPVPEFREVQPGHDPAVLANPVQFLMMLEAEEQLLVNIDIRVMPHQLTGFERQLRVMYDGDGSSPASAAWSEFRQDVVHQAVEEFLVPTGRAWVKEWLREECREWLGRACEMQLGRRIDCRPYESRSMLAKARTSKLKSAQMWTENDDDDADEDEAEERLSWSSPTVMAVSHGIGDPRIDRTKVVVLDARGHLLHSETFDGLNPPRNQHDAPQTLDLPEGVIATPRDREAYDARMRFITLLKRRQPDVVVVTGFSPRTVGLRALVEIMADRAHREMFAASKFSDEDTNAQLAIDVISVHDDVARLYQHSKRGEEEHPSLDVLSRYCVGVARYAQSPLQEFAALTEDELVSLRHDANQNLLPKERLLLHLERTISAVTNELCVDINRAAHDNYYGALLKHVSGLGPRKAAALVRAIHSGLEGTVVNRDALLYGSPDSALGQSEETQAILTQKVWHNACAFLTIRTARRQELQGRPDVLDATRIHPQNYRYARFIAFDALRKTEEDKEDGDHESQFCRELLRDDRRRERVQTIDLADYERALLAEQAAKGEARQRKLTQLEFIARELVQPCRDERNTYALPTPDDMLTALTGETERTLRNVDVNVTVVTVLLDSIIVRLDSGMEGTINGEYLHLGHEHYERTGQRPPRLRDIVKKEQVLKAQIIDLDKATLRVELTARPDHLAQMHAGGNARAVRPDPKYFNIELDAKARDRAAAERRRRTNMRNTRSIVHPNFKNFKAGQAEEYLANPAFEIGTAVVRPSSKGNDHLAVTWKVEEGVYQHIDVLELDKENEYELGKVLRVGNMGTYSDLDELLVGHILPMAQMVKQLVHHEKYKGSEEQLDQSLISFAQANPNRSVYGFALDRQRPGMFSLGFKANREAPIQRWPVRVLPGRFKLRDADQLPDVNSLCNSFKTQYTTQASAARGGRTPGHLGAATPRGALGQSYGNYGGATPAGAATPGRYGAYGGATPMAGGLASRTPYGAGAGAGMPARTPMQYPGAAAAPAAPPGPPPRMPPPGYGAPPPGMGGMPPPGMGGMGGMGAQYGAMPPGPPPPAPGPPPGAPPAQPKSGFIHPDRLAQRSGGGAF